MRVSLPMTSSIMEQKSVNYHNYYSECGANITVNATGGYITSPNYPLSYPPNSHCQWIFRPADLPGAVHFYAASGFVVELSVACIFDYLTTVAGSYCECCMLEVHCS